MIVIIGGGPAGISAALAAAENGAQIILIESSSRLGGQYWRHKQGQNFSIGNSLTAHSQVEVLLNAHVWHASYKAGKTTVVNFLFGQVMRSAGGKANPQVLREELEKQLNTEG